MSDSLTELEILAFKGLQAREREVQDKHVLPLRADFTRFTKLITERLNLPENALGTTHSINFEDFRIVAKPLAGPPPADPPLAG